MGISNIHDALEASELEAVIRRLTELVLPLEVMTETDMGHLNERQAGKFIEATAALRAILTELESGDVEHATYCGFCDVSHYPSDETEANSTHQQWQCHECGQWNDKANN